MWQKTLLWLCVAMFGAALWAESARAELIVLERVAADVAQEIQAAVGKSTVVVSVRQVGKTSLSWPVHEGLATELTAALRASGVDAISAATDVRIENLSDPKVDHTSADAKRVKGIDREIFVTGSLSTSGNGSLKLSVWKTDSATTSWTKTVSLPKDAFDLAANVPPLNRKVVEFCRAHFDQKVGAGECSQLATLSLEAATAKRQGIYTWGRELDDREPLMPGDCLQLELVEMKAPGFSRGFHHHTAVVEEVRPDAIVVLHQNVRPKGQIVQRDTWPKAAFKGGNAIAYRPTDGASPLAPLLPRRRSSATPAKRGNAIDVLKTVSPKLDCVKGIWFIEENSLRSNRDDFARLQIPIAPPEKYTLNLKVKRLYGTDQFAVGLVVGGRPVMCSFDAYASTASGLHLVGGKSVKNNPTTRKGAVLKQDKLATIRIQVTPQSVIAEVDGMPVVEWTGDSSQLSQDPKYAMPRTDWLYLASWNTQFAITECLLENGS